MAKVKDASKEELAAMIAELPEAFLGPRLQRSRYGDGPQTRDPQEYENYMKFI